MPSTPWTLPTSRLWFGDAASAEYEAAGREVAEIAREAVLDRDPEDGEVAGGGHLAGIGQAGSVAIDGPAHAERARLARHHRGEARLAAAERLCDDDGGIVGRSRDHPEDRVLDAQRPARPQAELGGRLGGGERGHRKLAVERQPARLQLLEQHIEGHHLGDGRGVTKAVGVDRIERAPSLHVVDIGGVARVGGALGGRPMVGAARAGGPHLPNGDGLVALGGLAVMPLLRGKGGIRGEDYRCGGRGDPAEREEHYERAARKAAPDPETTTDLNSAFDPTERHRRSSTLRRLAPDGPQLTPAGRARPPKGLGPDSPRTIVRRPRCQSR